SESYKIIPNFLAFVLKNELPHDFMHLIFQFFRSFIFAYWYRLQVMHFYPVRPEEEFFMIWKNSFCIKNNCRKNWFLCIDSQFKCAVMKTLQWFFSPVTCSFSKDHHMHSQSQNLFHF